MTYRRQDPRDARGTPNHHVATAALIPLRLFLGGTFLYAGLIKLLDPSFLAPSGPLSIAGQLTAFARFSPLSFLITGIALKVPILVGLGMALLEIAIGLGALTGVLFRLSAALGASVALLFWLTSSWATTPYFLGPDLPYAAGWLTLALAGAGGAWTLPAWLDRTRIARLTPAQRRRAGYRPEAGGWTSHDTVESQERRRTLQLIGLGAATLALGGPALVLGRLAAATRATTAQATRTPTATAHSTTSRAASTPTAAPSSADLLARGADLASTGSVTSVDPVTGDPVVVIKLPAGSVVAYDALCTHAGCTVEYDPASVTLICPCHGAQFDAAHRAAVLGGPTATPLAAIPITVNAAGDVSRKT